MCRFLILFSFLFFAWVSQAQNKDTILLMNGNYVVEKVLDTLIGAVTIVNPANVAEKLHYEYDEIYCVKYATGFTDYYYTQDTLNGNYFTREEMQYYIYGERDARKGFKAHGSLIGAGVVGLASGGLGLFFAPIFPYGYMALSGITKVRIKHKTISNPNYIDHDAYILGYERVSRTKRRIRALIGGTIGLAAGYGLYFGILKDQLPSTIKFRF
ncbi:MAG: hypothetical protein K0S53_1398 [Bacteroidetes bacterium]|nr:hypothetical protein [Bacteroidota bacterium]MDF2452608.1 hypothetical protein [Bacteroidota bacterium]